MLTHTVLFRLRADLDEAGRETFLTRLRTLLEIPGSERAVIGRPAATPARPVIVDDYDFALELDFTDVAAHNVYQEHPTHQAFIDGCRELWEEVRVIDFEEFDG